MNQTYAPNIKVILKTDHNARSLARISRFTAPMTPLDGAATALVCSNFICKEPTTDVPTMLARIKGIL